VSDRNDANRLLGRLLGPSAPEVGCDECFDQLDRFVELERRGDDADAAVPSMRPHLAGCPACHEEYDSLVALLADDEAGSAPQR
jgi:hypothetical protein